jgi:hypothetical protein
MPGFDFGGSFFAVTRFNDKLRPFFRNQSKYRQSIKREKRDGVDYADAGQQKNV